MLWRYGLVLLAPQTNVERQHAFDGESDSSYMFTVVSTLYLYFRVKANGYICLINLFKEVVNLPSSAALQ